MSAYMNNYIMSYDVYDKFMIYLCKGGANIFRCFRC